MHLIIRRFAGTLILLSPALARDHGPQPLWSTAFVGLNLLQSPFTHFCPVEIILERFGPGGPCCAK